MQFRPTQFADAYLIEPEKHEDERGFFARTWCRREFAAAGLNPNLAQANLSYNRQRGTLRGMHYQRPPREEAKLVSCIRGAVFDVIVDLREDSETFMQWEGFRLTAENHLSLYIPEGFAHGFQTLDDDTELIYQMSEFYHPESSRGIRFDDPAFGIEWPLDVTSISARDRQYPNFEFSNVRSHQEAA